MPQSPAKSLTVHDHLAVHDHLERTARLPGVVAQDGGDAGGTGQPEEGDGQVAQGRDDARAAGGVDLGAVLVPGRSGACGRPSGSGSARWQSMADTRVAASPRLRRGDRHDRQGVRQDEQAGQGRGDQQR